MDKLMLQAVAGAGKTKYLVDNLNETENVVIITYTEKNQEELRKSIIKKFKYEPQNIHVFGVFEFLYGFCYVPLQDKHGLEGLSFDPVGYYNRSYHTSDGRIYSSRLSKYIMDKKLPYLERINRFFDRLFIDEVQDLTADDFDWVMTLSNLEIPVTLVGDYYQSTFSSSRRGNKGKGIRSSYNNFKAAFVKNGFVFDDYTLLKSHRCSPSITSFIKDRLNIDMESHNNQDTTVKFIDDAETITKILENDSIIKLFYQDSKKYKIQSDNWGNVKGLTYEDVCVVLNATTLKKYPDKLYDLAPTTLSKFYVACTRPSRHLYFISHKQINNNYKE